MSGAGESRLDSRQLAAFVEGLDYPMFVVTAPAGGERSGCLVAFATQASIDPPRLLVCVSVVNHTYAVADAARVLAVHVRDPEQRGLAELFGAETGDEVDKFEHCRWRRGPDGRGRHRRHHARSCEGHRSGHPA